MGSPVQAAYRRPTKSHAPYNTGMAFFMGSTYGLFYRTVYNAVQNLLLANDIEKIIFQ